MPNPIVPKNRPRVGQVLRFIHSDDSPDDKEFIMAQRRELTSHLTVSKVVDAPQSGYGFFLEINMDGAVVANSLGNGEPATFSPFWLRYDGEYNE